MACAFASPYSSKNYRKIDLNHYSTVCHYYTEVRNCNYLPPLQLSSSLVLIQNGDCVIRVYEKPTVHPLLVLSVFKSSAKEASKIKENITSI